MPLVPLELPAEGPTPPPEVAAFFAASRLYSARFVEESHRTPDERIAGFVASNLPFAFSALQAIRAEGLAPGASFCEWGSGQGAVTCLASLLGFSACGIEIEPRLVAESRRFARERGIPARFFEGSYTPPGTFTDEIDEDALDLDLGFSPMRFDVIYAYPWPAEELVVPRLVERYAPPGTVLITYHGGTQIRAACKVGD